MSPETCSETSWPECAFATEIWNAMVVAEDAVPSPGGSLRRRRLILKKNGKTWDHHTCE